MSKVKREVAILEGMATVNVWSGLRGTNAQDQVVVVAGDRGGFVPRSL